MNRGHPTILSCLDHGKEKLERDQTRMVDQEDEAAVSTVIDIDKINRIEGEDRRSGNESRSHKQEARRMCCWRRAILLLNHPNANPPYTLARRTIEPLVATVRLTQHRPDPYSGAVADDLPSGPAQHEVVSSRVQTHAAK